MVVKSQRSSTTRFNQWSASSNSSVPHPIEYCDTHPRPYNPYSSLNATPLRQTPAAAPAPAPALTRSTPAPPPITLPSQIIVPGSPSQTDPFGSQITSPEPIPRSTPVIIGSRPPSTILSASSCTSPLTLNGTPVVTPKIILASPSTSTIHYLFPSSDTRNGIHLSATSTTSTGESTNVGTSTVGSTKGTDNTKPVKRTQSTSRTDKSSSHPHRSSIIYSHRTSLDQPVERERTSTKQILHGLGYHKKTTSITANSPNPTRRNLPGTSPGTTGGGGGVKKSDIGKPIPSPALDYTSSAGYRSVGEEVDMGTLRRQRAMVDLGGVRSKTVELKEVGIKRKESLILKEIENRREKRGWEIGSRPYQESEPVDPCSHSRTTATHSRSQIRVLNPKPKPYVPPSITVLAQRRRSQSLSAPRPAPSPPIIADDQVSPLLPPPDFGDPLTLSVVIPSPSYSHLDYSTAGSTSESTKSKRSSVSGGWSMRRSSVIFPISAAMSRGDMRKGLGGYDDGKVKAREDAAKRLNGDQTSADSRKGSMGRSWSLRRKRDERREDEYGQGRKESRPRSQSLTAALTLREMGITPPLPLVTQLHPNATSEGGSGGRAFLPLQQNTNGTFIGDLSIDLGDRYFSPHKDTPSSGGWTSSPRSIDTSVFSSSTPSSEYASLPSATIRNIVRIGGKPLHPAFNESDISILAPSTVGLGFSPIGTPISLPESLEAEVVDLTLQGRKLASPIPIVHTGQSPDRPGHGTNTLEVTIGQVPNFDRDREASPRVPRRSMLLAQNTFYIPPPGTKPTMSSRPSLRSSMSMGQGAMKRAFTSGNLKQVAAGQTGSGPSGQPRTGGLMKSASIRSNSATNRSKSRLFEREKDRSLEGGTERVSPTPSTSMRFGTSSGSGGGRRPMTTFSLCSPPDAIDPLPPTNCTLSISPAHNLDPDFAPSSSAPGRSKTLRSNSNRSSPFLSASNSLRVIFGREGFVARSLSQAFDKDKDNHRAGHDDRTMMESSLKAKISSPLEAAPPSRADDQKWRESILKDVVSLSISSNLNKLASEQGQDQNKHHSGRLQGSGPRQGQNRMVSSGSKARLAIPSPLLQPFMESELLPETTMRESRDMTGIGEAMMRSVTRGTVQTGHSVDDVLRQSSGGWEGPTGRVLGEVGGVDSMASASVYSNNASTFHDSARKPSARRMIGKGLPPSGLGLSTMTSTSTSTTQLNMNTNTSRWSPSPKKKAKEEHREKARTFSGRISARLISPPIPFMTPMSGVQYPRSDMEVEKLREPIELNVSTLRTPVSLKSRSGHIATASRNPAYEHTNPPTLVDEHDQDPVPTKETKGKGLKMGRSQSINFSLSLRSSFRLGGGGGGGLGGGGGRSRPSPSPAGTHQHQGISNQSYAQSHVLKSKSPSTSGGISSEDVLPQEGRSVLDQLAARDKPTTINLSTATANATTAGGVKVGDERVLEWRDEVGENEQLTKLEDKMRGFVDGERERIRVIGRKSLDRGLRLV
ncbi:hypothetical protein CI109_101467 [Kwoniella shandongensis]|uniref:Uncharacterized protein n=1 Tax=Kwoniella shandongensis TaxID=1734106 RepID=A0A5M6C396_9TREE|nr:uncharacterized protein CI109_001939 [Kwoniella shandongensis]KAA5529514.1 hypothetical protein CI109_001939 [Kwoniella shandongensis]